MSKIMDIHDIIEGQDSRAEFLLEGIIPKGKIIGIFGNEYKSFFALWAAMRMSYGSPLFIDESGVREGDVFCSTAPQKVIFIGEDIPAITVERTKIMLKNASDTITEKDFKRNRNLNFEFDQDRFLGMYSTTRGVVERCLEKGINVVFIDSFWGFTAWNDEEKESEIVKRAMDCMKEFIKRGITVVFTHTPSKESWNKIIDDNTDVKIVMEKKDKDSNVIDVSFKKIKCEGAGNLYRFKTNLAEKEDGSFYFDC